MLCSGRQDSPQELALKRLAQPVRQDKDISSYRSVACLFSEFDYCADSADRPQNQVIVVVDAVE